MVPVNLLAECVIRRTVHALKGVDERRSEFGMSAPASRRVKEAEQNEKGVSDATAVQQEMAQ
jgi:hypothetical protein